MVVYYVTSAHNHQNFNEGSVLLFPGTALRFYFAQVIIMICHNTFVLKNKNEKIEDLTHVVISCEFYEMSLWQVT